MADILLELEYAVLAADYGCFAHPLDFRIEKGCQTALVGPNASGKTLLVEALAGKKALRSGRLINRLAPGEFRYIAFQETFNRAEDVPYYYQQRWNSSDSSQAPTVKELLSAVDCDPEWRQELLEMLDIDKLLEKPVIQLSSGELRKFQIIRILLTRARVLAIDCPFIGLDKQAREVFTRLMEKVAERTDIQFLLIVNTPDDIPAFVDKIYSIHHRKVESGCLPVTCGAEPFAVQLPTPSGIAPESEQVLKLSNVTIRYGERTILRNLNWTVNQGEYWALNGPNGSGKSTLLSLISADNPQAYSQNIELFGRKRGSGESIWDIKRHIGFVSSEMHRSFVKDIPAVNIAASGFFDSVGLYRQASDGQLAEAGKWLLAFGVGEKADSSFVRLSSGEQRLVLLARALVKDPALLILDEPLNGLDPVNKSRVKRIIDEFSSRRAGKSLIYVSHYEQDLPHCINHYKHLEIST